MSDAGLHGVIVSHGPLGGALVDAVTRITGQADALVAVSNEGCSGNSLIDLVAEAAGGRACLVFVDLPAGSCFQAAAKLQRHHPTMTVVAGVNLAMLLDFVHHRDLSLDEAAERAVRTGVQAIRIVGS